MTMTKCQIGNWNNVQESAFHIHSCPRVLGRIRPPFIHEDTNETRIPKRAHDQIEPPYNIPELFYYNP